MDKDDENVLVCFPVSRGQPEAKSYQGNCDMCDCAIWISYSSSELLTKVSKKVCPTCFTKMRPDDFELAPPEGEQLDEIMKVTGMTREEILDLPNKIKEWIKQNEGN